MSGLLTVLKAHEEEICETVAEQLERADCATLAKTASGNSRAMFDALVGCCSDKDDFPVRDWAKGLYVVAQADEQPVIAAPYHEVLAATNCLEQTVRLHIVRAVSQKKTLMAVLSDLGSGANQLRDWAADVLVTASSRKETSRKETPRKETPRKETPDRKPSDDEPPETLFRVASECSRDYFCLATIHGKPLFLNAAGRRLVGLDEEESLASSNLFDFYSDVSWQELCDVAVPAVNRSGHWEGRNHLRNRKTGDLVDLLTTMLLIRGRTDEKASYLAIWHLNPRQWEHTDQALVESIARKNAILESSLDPIVTIDHQGLISEFNHAAEQTFGHPREKILGTRPAEVLFPESTEEDHQNRIDRYLTSGEGSLLGQRVEGNAVRANGETFPAEMAMTMGQEQGAPVLTYFIRDISQQKKAEQAQIQYAAELERSNQELEQFAYVASHDLQEPLRKIRTFSDRLEMKCSEMLDETGHECIGRMQNAAARAQDLIEGLLTLSRITTRGGNFTAVDLGTIAQEVLSDLEVRIERSAGRVELVNLPTLQADPLQMRQLLQNLVGNAVKFHRSDEPPVVKVHGRYVGRGPMSSPGRPATDEKVRIVVEDNGIGFEEKYMERVFGIFQRLHPRDVYEGTGIGLAICRKIVDRHGGTITARSAPGRGSTFEVVLPVVQPRRKDT